MKPEYIWNFRRNPPMNLRILSLNITEEKISFFQVIYMLIRISFYYVLRLRPRTISRMIEHSDSWIIILSAGNAWEMSLSPLLSFIWRLHRSSLLSIPSRTASPSFVDQFLWISSCAYRHPESAGWSTGLCQLTNSLYITSLVCNYPLFNEQYLTIAVHLRQRWKIMNHVASVSLALV